MVISTIGDPIPAAAHGAALSVIDDGDITTTSDDPNERAKKIVDTLLRVVYRGHVNAQEANRPFHDRMQLYRRLERAIAPFDGDPGDPLAELWTPAIGALVETSVAQEITTLVPDPASMDQIEVHPEELGVEDYCEAMTRKLRADYIAMRPMDAPNGYIDLLAQQLRDKYVTGNCFETSAFQVYSGMHEGQDFVAGVTKNRPDPVNVYPWNLGITSATHQKFTIYDPCTDDDLERMGIPDAIIQEVVEKCVYQPLQPVDSEDQDYEYWASDMQRNLNQNQNAYKRIIYSGFFPWGEFRREWGQSADDLPDKAEVVMALASQFEFDVAEIDNDSYWDIQWIYPVIVRCRPLQLDLPPGAGPIRHAVQYPVAQQFWGEGFYDRAQMHERLSNYFQQCAARIAGLLADPPVMLRKHLLDMDQLQLNGVTPRLEHGMALWVKQSSSMDHSPAVEPLKFNAEALTPMNQQEAGQKDQIRQITGLYSDIVGQSSSKLATVNANNMQQGLMLFQASIKRFENGFQKRGAEADYVVLCQAIKMGGTAIELPMSVENKILSSLTITPEMLLPLGPVSIRMTGTSNPSNRIHMVEALLKYCNTFIPTGAVDVQFLASMVAQYMDLPQRNRIVHDPANADLFKRVINAKQLLGDSAIQYFSPQELMGIGLIPPPAPPSGQPGATGAPGQPPPAGAPAGPAQAPGPPPMQPAGQGAGSIMPGNNGFSQTAPR